MSIVKGSFGTLPDGRAVDTYTLENKNGMSVCVTPFGCRILTLMTKDKNGKLGDMVLGHSTLEEYARGSFHGTFVGRYANRIKGAKFTLNGKTYELTKNNGENSLHGGPKGYHQVLWQVKETVDGDEPKIVFAHVSPDGDENFPGTLSMTVTYVLTADNALSMEYEAETDQETPFNPTNHSFFNLSGDFQKEIYDTELTLNASKVTAVTDDLIPTGELIPVAGGPLDFTKGKKIGKDIFSEDHLIKLCGGYDHNFCVDGKGFRKIAEAYEPESGRVMETFSDMPGVQLFTSNHAGRSKGKDGELIKPHTAFCLETQFYPDSPNHPEFPFSFLKPGETFRSKTVYRFSVKK